MLMVLFVSTSCELLLGQDFLEAGTSSIHAVVLPLWTGPPGLLVVMTQPRYIGNHHNIRVSGPAFMKI